MATQNSPENRFAEWDRLNTILLRYWTIYEETGMTLKTDEEKKRHNEEFRREVQFLIRKSCDPDFHIFLNKRLFYTKEAGRKSGLVIRKHMRELAKFILLDKWLRKQGKFLKIGDLKPLENKGRHDTDNQGKSDLSIGEGLGYQYAQLLNIVNHYYPELLTTREELQKQTGTKKSRNGRWLDNHRERIVETVFSREEKLPQGIFDLIVKRAMREDATEKFYGRMHMQNEEMIKSTMCDPIDIAKLLAFRDNIHEIISEIGENPFLRNPKEQLPESVQNLLIQMLFQQVRWLVEFRWFEGKSPAIQHSIIFKEPKVTKFHKKDAAKAVALSFLWFNNPEKVMKSMVLAGSSYVKYVREPQPEVGLWLIQECLKQLSFSKEDTALAYYNIAMMYQKANQLRLMMRWLKKAQKLWEQISDHPGDIADTFAYMAEYWRVSGNTEKYRLYRDKAEGMLKNDTFLPPRRRLFHYLFFADCAAMFEDKDWEQHLYELGKVISSSDPSLIDFANFFKQCLGDLREFGERGPQGGPGRFAPPADYNDLTFSSSFKTWIFDD